MNKYIVSVYPGVGYYTKQIEVDAYSEDEALESAMCYCQKMGLRGLYIEANVEVLDLCRPGVRLVDRINGAENWIF